jgi:hypothetical protein
MPLMMGTAFLVGALLTCVIPIGLMLAFTAFSYRQVRRLPPNPIPDSAVAPGPVVGEPLATPQRPLGEE